MKPLSFSDPNVLDQSIVVSASAGSGKTFTLSVLVLLALGRMEARAYEIIASTYSEAAAADLRERLLRPLDLLATLDLDTWGQLLPIGPDFSSTLESLELPPNLSKSSRELIEAAPNFGLQPWMSSPTEAQCFWRKTRREAELMHVSTLHSLALGLLRGGKGTPDWVLDAAHPALLRALRQAMREVADIPEDHHDYLAASALLEWAKTHWEQISKSHDAHRDAMGRFNLESSEDPRLELQSSLAKAMETFQVFANDPDLAINHGSSHKWRFEPDKLLAPPAPDSPLPTQIQWAERQSAVLGCQAKKLPKYYSEEFREGAATLSAVASAWEAWLGAVLSKVLARFEEIKSLHGIATFGDMVRSALDGLADGSIAPPRPKLLLVDEYQDTSKAQDEFLGALGAARVIRVGDAKQAIYGFRGCSSEIFQEHARAAGDRAYRLVANYRSAPAIVDMVNTFVKDVWPAKDPSFVDMEAEQTPQAKGSYPVAAVFADSTARGTDLPGLSPWITALSSESGWEKTLCESQTAASASTRALLLRQRTKLPALLMHLKRFGVQPYVLAKTGFWDSPGVRLLMTALEAYAHPSRPLPCLVLLRHFAAMSDLELHRMDRAKGIGGLDTANAPEEKRTRIAWLQSLQTASTQGIAAGLLADGYLLAVIASTDAHGAMEPPRARRNLAGFLATLQGLPADPATAFAQLNEMRNGPDRGDLPAASQDADLIIQTVHASKGLEYDDVILPLLRNKITGIRTGHILTDPETLRPMLAWKIGDERGQNYERIADMVKVRQCRDDMNLFYVALTRAKNRLCLLVQTKTSEKDTGKEPSHYPWAQLGKELFESHPGILELTNPPEASPQNQPRARVSEKPTRTEKASSKAASPVVPPSPESWHSQEERTANLRARQEGEEMHAYLQNLLVRWSDAQAFSNLLDNPPSIANAKENATRFLGEFEKRGWRHLHRRTEMTLQGASASGTKGRADLVVWDEACIYIVDFKHVQKLNKEDEDIYAQQLNRYATAISKQYQGTPVKAWLALLKSGVWKEIDVKPSL